MGDLLNATLINRVKENVSGKELEGKIVALYFSAHWCPPCRGFTPILKQFYENAKKSGGNVEIVFISADGSQEEMLDYFCNHHGDYLALPFGSEVSEKLDAKYGVSGIPCLIVIKQDGSVAVPNARGAVQSCGENVAEVLKQWEEACK